MTFRTSFKTFKYLRMSFKLINALVIFQKYILQVLALILEKEVLVYLNNILIVSKIKKEHQKKIKKIKRLLTEAELMIKEEKYKYFKKELKFLGFKLMNERIEKDSQKMKAV